MLGGVLPVKIVIHRIVLYILLYCTFLHCIYFAPVCHKLACWRMLSVLNTTWDENYPILFYKVRCIFEVMVLVASSLTPARVVRNGRVKQLGYSTRFK